jgi:ferric-dicitrate binding protein FerR (iron transport regulator)
VAGARPAVPDERYLRVRPAVRARGETGARRRVIHRRVAIGSVVVAAAAALVVLAVRLGDRTAPVPAGESVAVVERIAGTAAGVSRAIDEGAPAPLAAGDQVRTGEWVETTAGARVALRFANGTSVRLDGESRVRPLSPFLLELVRGAVYVDTGTESGRLEVRTPVATARDIGTQFEVRLIQRQLRLRVRAGLVELTAAGRSLSARGGTEVLLSAEGTETRPLATYGAEWAWTAAVLRPWDIEGMTLLEFLERFSREHGWTVEYADPPLAREAADIVLHGNISDLSPTDGLEVVISTSGLAHELSAGRLFVYRQPSTR